MRDGYFSTPVISIKYDRLAGRRSSLSHENAR